MISKYILNRSALLFCMTLLTFSSGCGKGKLEKIPYRGRTTLNGKQWPKEGILYFTSLEPAEGFTAQPATAKFDAEGNFSATTRVEGDGIVPGKYRIHVMCWESMPTLEKAHGVSYVPRKYQSGATTDKVIDIAPDSEPQIDVQLDFTSN